MTPAAARSQQVRRIVADVLERSFGGTTERTRFREDLQIRGSQEDEISWRIANQLGVAVPAFEWSYFVTVADLAAYVNRHAVMGAEA